MRARRVEAVGAAVVVLVGTGCLCEAWLSGAATRRLVPVAAVAGRPATTTTRLPAPATAGSAVSDPLTSAGAVPNHVAAPVTVEVRAVDLDVRVVPVGLTSDGAIAVPDPAVAGWYDLGPAPGAVGPAVVVGHVDTRSGAAVFYPLNRVRAGETVTVVRSDGSRQDFVVRQLTEVRKAQFPTAEVFAPTSDAELRLVTCTGQFDTSTGHYVDSLIVWATAVNRARGLQRMGEVQIVPTLSG